MGRRAAGTEVRSRGQVSPMGVAVAVIGPVALALVARLPDDVSRYRPGIWFLIVVTIVTAIWGAIPGIVAATTSSAALAVVVQREPRQSAPPAPVLTLVAFGVAAAVVIWALMRLQRAHRRSIADERRYRSLAEASAAIVSVVDGDGRLFALERPWEGYTGHEINDDTARAAQSIHPDDRAAVVERWNAGIASAEPFEWDCRLWHAATSEHRWTHGRAVPVLDGRGGVAEWVVTVTDVHEEVLAREALEEATNRLATVLRTAPVGMAFVGRDLRYHLVNERFAEMTGIGVEAHADRRVADGEPELAAELLRNVGRVLADGEPILEVQHRRIRDGATEDWLASYHPVADRRGTTVGVGITSVDVTEHNRNLALARYAQRVAEHDADRAARLQTVTSAVGLVDDEAGFVRTVLEEVVSAADADEAIVGIVQPSGDLRLWMRGLPDELARAFPALPAGAQGPLPDTVRAGEPMFVQSPEALGARFPQLEHWRRRCGVMAGAWLPMRAEGTEGVLHLGYYERHGFAPGERSLLLAIADVCAQALRRVRLHDAERDARAAAEAAARHLHALQTISDTAIAGLTLDRLVSEALERVREVLGVDTVRILLLSADGTRLRQAGALGIGIDPDLDIPVGEGFAGRVAALRRPLVVDQTAHQSILSPTLRARGLRTLVGVPLSVGDRLVGVLHVGSVAPRSFDDAELELLALAAGRLAVAIERSQLYDWERAARERSEFLAQTNRVLAESLDRVEIMRAVTRAAVPRLGDWCSIHLVDDPALPPEVQLAFADPDRAEWAGGILRRWTHDPDGAVGVPAVLRGGDTEFHPDVSDDLLRRAAPDEVTLGALRELAPRSAIIVPLRTGGRVLGAMQLLATHEDRRHSPDDVTLAESLAGRVAAALDNARLYEAQRDIAQTLQRSLLPTALPDLGFVETAARYWTAGVGTEVGGDFYDVIRLDDGTCAVSIGDVCGKGVRAAAFTGLARHTIRAAAGRQTSPAGVLRWLHEAIKAEHTEDYCTAVYGRMTRARDGAVHFSFSAGGHPLPVLMRRDGSVELVGRPGSILGFFDPIVLHESTVVLRPGDTVILYTDGVTDVPGPAGLDDRALVEFVGGCAAGSAEELAEALGSALEARRTHAMRQDDTAILVVRVPDPTPTPAILDLKLVGPVSVRQTRDRLARWLRLGGVPPAVCDELRVVISELVTNAIEASPDSPVVVRARLADDEVELEVLNRTDAPYAEPTGDGEPWAARGRGLAVARALTDEFTIEHVDGEVRARAARRIERPGPLGPAASRSDTTG